MNLYLHLSIHIFFAFLAGLIVWRFCGKAAISFLSGLIGGFLIDFDHFIDYFFAFGRNFNLDYFFHGFQFLKSGKIYILFHAWEYAIIFLVVSFLLGKRLFLKSVLLALALGIFFHIGTDLVINEGTTLKGYSLIYRAKHNFEVKQIVSPEHYEKYLIEKRENKF